MLLTHPKQIRPSIADLETWQKGYPYIVCLSHPVSTRRGADVFLSIEYEICLDSVVVSLEAIGAEKLETRQEYVTAQTEFLCTWDMRGPKIPRLQKMPKSITQVVESRD